MYNEQTDAHDHRIQDADLYAAHKAVDDIRTFYAATFLEGLHAMKGKDGEK